jgi:uncharacterized protein YgfB (UPF0149 family)
MQLNPAVQPRPWSIELWYRNGIALGLNRSELMGAIAGACVGVGQDASWVPVGPSHPHFIAAMTATIAHLEQIATNTARSGYTRSN